MILPHLPKTKAQVASSPNRPASSSKLWIKPVWSRFCLIKWHQSSAISSIWGRKSWIVLGLVNTVVREVLKNCHFSPKNSFLINIRKTGYKLLEKCRLFITNKQVWAYPNIPNMLYKILVFFKFQSKLNLENHFYKTSFSD